MLHPAYRKNAIPIAPNSTAIETVVELPAPRPVYCTGVLVCVTGALLDAVAFPLLPAAVPLDTLPLVKVKLAQVILVAFAKCNVILLFPKKAPMPGRVEANSSL